MEGLRFLGHGPHDTPSIAERNTLCIARHANCVAMMRTPGDRLRELREAKGYQTAKEAAEAFGWNEVTYRAHENGTRTITFPVARKYAQAYAVRPGYILTGESNNNSAPHVNLVANVPLVGTVSAGVFREAEGLVSEGVLVPAVPRPDVPASAQYAVKVDGPSVNQKIPDGAYAIVAKLESFPGGPSHGTLVHVVREKAGLYEHTIKELRYTREGVRLAPVSSDPRFQGLLDPEDDEDAIVRIEGVVIGKYEPL